jgi:hypothetical protein
LTPVTFTGHRPDKNGLHMDKGRPCLLQTRQNCSLTYMIFHDKVILNYAAMSEQVTYSYKGDAMTVGQGGKIQSDTLYQHFLHQSLMFETKHLPTWIGGGLCCQVISLRLCV